MSAATLAPASVQELVTEDGLLVRLSGVLDTSSTPQLRAALLRTRPAGCDDVIIDAGDVSDVDDDALAVLLAAGAWVVDTGGRLSFSRMSEAVRRDVDRFGLESLLPMLDPAGKRAVVPSVPYPRTASAN